MNSIILMAESAAGSNTASSGITPIIMFAAVLAIMYFTVMRPQKKKQKEEQEMRSSLEIGDEIVTIGGIIGRVVTIRENDIIIETGSDRNKMKIERWAVGRNITKEEQHRKEVDAAREAAKAKKAKKKDVVDETKNNKGWFNLF